MAPRSTALLALLALSSLRSVCVAFPSALPKASKVRTRFDSMISEVVLPPATIEVPNRTLARSRDRRGFGIGCIRSFVHHPTHPAPLHPARPHLNPTHARKFIDSPQQRLLFKGAAAAAENPTIREAFAIVYEDMGPIRVAGDLIYNLLSGVAAEAKVTAGSEPLLASVAGDADAAATLTATRLLFDLIDADASGALDREELLRSPELAAYIVRGEDGEDPEAAVDRFIATADENGDGVISFIEFAAAAAADPTLNSMDEALSAALARTAEGAGRDGDGSGEGAPVRTRGRFGRKRPDERFESMMATCLEWEVALGCAPPPGGDDDEAEECDLAVLEQQEALVDGRLLVVLRGGWEIARCEPVTEALRYAYTEYSSLRLGGDLIFKLLSKVVDGKARSS